MEMIKQNIGMDEIVALMEYLPPEQLKEVEEKVKEKRLNNVERATKENERSITLINKKITDLQKSIEEQGKYLDKINVLATDDAKMSDLQDTVKARVMSYLKKDYMNILFKEKFFAKCWSDLKAQFDVPKYSRIKIKDFESAIDTVKVWSPSAKYIRKEIEKYQRLQNSKKGDLLKPQVSKALDLYIEEYNKEN